MEKDSLEQKKRRDREIQELQEKVLQTDREMQEVIKDALKMKQKMQKMQQEIKTLEQKDARRQHQLELLFQRVMLLEQRISGSPNHVVKNLEIYAVLSKVFAHVS